LPLLNGFIGEFTILQGAFEANWWAAFAVTGVIFGAAYLLWLYQRTMLGQVTNRKNLGLPGSELREWAVFAPLIVGHLDRRLSEALLRHSGEARRADRGARQPRLLRKPPAGLWLPAARTSGDRTARGGE
jgi:NADH:ubiquinone oxidoreductase subunit 5 (subunit L)/multisubunit Na+/H+ antiporter MnhA subunit